jgi:hypothetical protein
MVTVRAELEESHEITIEKVKKIADEYYSKDAREIPEEKLPYQDKKKTESKISESKPI